MDVAKILRKNIQLGPQSLVGNKDLRRLKNSISASYSSAILKFDVKVDEFFPKDTEIRVAKISQTKIVVYFAQNNPIFFETDNQVYPTVYTLWKAPQLVFSFVTHAPVSTFLLKGADLMLPGVIHPKNGFDEIDKGHVCSVRVVRNKFPFSVGRCLMDRSQLVQRGLKGKCVEVLHTFGDALWQLGKKDVPSPSFTLEIVNGNDDEDDVYDATAHINESFNMMKKTKTKSSKNKSKSKKDAWNEEEEEEEEEEGGEEKKNGEEKSKIADDWETCDNGEPPLSSHEHPSSVHEEKAATSPSSDAHNLSNEEEEKENESDEVGKVQNKLNNLNIDDEKNSKNKEKDEEEDEEEEKDKTMSNLSKTDDNLVHFTPEQMDEVLHYCLMEVIATGLTDDQLPLDISALYGRMVNEAVHVMYHPQLQQKLEGMGMNIKEILTSIKNGEKDVQIDVKKSTYKKLLKFIQCKIKEKLMQTKVNRATTSVIKVNREHPKIKGYVCIPEKQKQQIDMSVGGGEEKGGGGGGGGAAAGSAEGNAKQNKQTQSREIEVTEAYQIRECHQPMFTSLKIPFGKNVYMSMGECRSALERYINEILPQNVPQTDVGKDEIKLDPILAKALLAKNESMEKLTKSDAFLRFQSRLQVYHTIVNLNETSIKPIKYIIGKPPTVKISTEQRSGRKHVTNIEGLSAFLEDLSEVAEFMQKKLACASSTYEMPGKPKELGVMVQGNMTSQVADILSTKFCVPKKYIEIVQKKSK